MCIAVWITKATDTHSEYVILIAFPRQKWLQERTPTFRYIYCAAHKIHQWQKRPWTVNALNVHSEHWSVRWPLLQYVTAFRGIEIACCCFTVGGAKIYWFQLKGRRDFKFIVDYLFDYISFILFLINSSLLTTHSVTAHRPPSPYTPVSLCPSHCCLNPHTTIPRTSPH